MPGTGRRRPVSDLDLDPKDILLSERELGQRWGLQPRSLSSQRLRGEGCPYVRIGRNIRYRMSDVLAYELAVAPAGGQ
jgi:hypothetical protein